MQAPHFLKRAHHSYPHEHVHKASKAEFIVALLITIALTASLFSEQYIAVPHYLTPLLILLFLGIKGVHILRKGGTLVEDYAGIGVIGIFLILYLILRAKLSPLLIVVFIVVLFYSAGFMLWVKTTFTSKKVTHFIASYLITVLMIVFLFAGAYLSRSESFNMFSGEREFTFEDALYFSAVTITTVGYGDITPIGVNRVFASIEALLGMIINVVLMGYILASGRFRDEYP